MTVATLITQLKEHDPSTVVMVRSEKRANELNEVKTTKTLDLPVSTLDRKLKRYVEMYPSDGQALGAEAQSMVELGA
jgi:hypothetical protein